MSEEKLYDVFTPNTSFNGERNGVFFTKGAGRATKAQAKRLVNHWGYKCPELSPDSDEEQETDQPKETGSQAIEAWQHAVAAVKELETAEDIDAFTKGDDRKSVVNAAAARKEELAKAEETEESEAAAGREDEETDSDTTQAENGTQEPEQTETDKGS